MPARENHAKAYEKGRIKEEGGDECGPLGHSAPMSLGDEFYKGAAGVR